MVHKKTLVRQPDPPSKWPRWTGFRGKTAWDWMDLLIVPLALVGIGLLFSMLQDTRQQNLENQRQEQALVIENQRAKAERELAEKRADDEALQAYLDQMSGLLLERDLRASEEDSEVRTLARARTLTVLGRLDPSRKTALMQFLGEADLVQGAFRCQPESCHLEGGHPIILLSDADLSDADLKGANLSGAMLAYADLSDTNLRHARLQKARLISANLSDANLSGAVLFEADLFVADLSDTDLSPAFLSSANLSLADLSGANLSSISLIDVDLSDADLSGANLSGANLSDTKLSNANLSNAVLRNAVGITNEELEQQAATLDGATMPNGQKYEEWLKDKKSDGKDEKNE